MDNLKFYEPYDELTWSQRPARGGCFGMLLYFIIILMLFVAMFVKYN